MHYRYRKPLLLMYDGNYRYGTGLYAPAVHGLSNRGRDFDMFRPSSPISVQLPKPLPTIPKVSLFEHDLYAPVSYGYGRSLLKPRAPPQREPRLGSRYYPFYYGMDEY